MAPPSSAALSLLLSDLTSSDPCPPNISRVVSPTQFRDAIRSIGAIYEAYSYFERALIGVWILAFLAWFLYFFSAFVTLNPKPPMLHSTDEPVHGGFPYAFGIFIFVLVFVCWCQVILQCRVSVPASLEAIPGSFNPNMLP
jgi:hypothetical protein